MCTPLELLEEILPRLLSNAHRPMLINKWQCWVPKKFKSESLGRSGFEHSYPQAVWAK